MRIAIDAHSVGTGLGGNETYATNLIEALAEVDSENQYTLYVTTREAVNRFSDRWSNFKVRSTLPHTPLIRIPLTLSAELRRRPVDLLHVQYTAPPLVPCRVVSTIHDLAFEHLPETFKRRSWMQMRLTVRYTARTSSHIITGSNFSRQDIIDTYKVPPDRITVTPSAAPSSFAPASEAEIRRVRNIYGIADDYILAVGSIQPRKNLVRLMAAYANLRRQKPPDKLPPLVLVGKCAWLYDDTLRTIEEFELQKSVVLTGYVPETDLPALYSGSLCFVYPSYFEGFGLPPMEAMKCGAAVIAGDKTSLPEVVGDAGLLVDPFDVDAIAVAINKLITDPALRASLRTRGLERSKTFDWRKTARQTLAVYERTVGVNNKMPR